MSSGETGSTSISARSPLHNYLLLAGGYFSLAFAIFQLSGIWWSASAVKYLGGPADMRVHRPATYGFLCLTVALGAAIFGLYSLSGAGKIRRLPLLRTVLIIVAAIYLLRGLLAIPQAPMVLKHPELARFLLFSLISLVVGVVYSMGVFHLFRNGRPGESPSLRI
jgi:hypothetical protein